MYTVYIDADVNGQIRMFFWPCLGTEIPVILCIKHIKGTHNHSFGNTSGLVVYGRVYNGFRLQKTMECFDQ